MVAKLLPSGFYDLIPPHAATRRRVVNSLLDTYANAGYLEVEPPLMEFEDSLLEGQDDAMSRRAFRVLDPLTQKIMAVRPDITLQISRMVNARLIGDNLPLKLCYHGEVLRVRGEGAFGARQLTQAGVELLGAYDYRADCETIALAAQSLKAAGFKDITIDLNLPSLPRKILAGVDEKIVEITLEALSCKDYGFISRQNLNCRDILLALLESAGPLPYALQRLQALPLPVQERDNLRTLEQTYIALQKMHPDLNLSLDVTENHGFAYHTGIAYGIYIRNLSGEIGSGGRYNLDWHDKQVPATGFTLYVNPLLKAMES